MKKEDFNYYLPEELIAQTPIRNREESKLLILDKTNSSLEDRRFKDIIDYIRPGDCLVLNDTRVMPARLFGKREGKEEKIEFLLLKRYEGDIWETLVKPGKKARPGNRIIFGQGILKAEILSIELDGTRRIEFYYDGIFEEILDRLGEMPLPPYITRKLEDKERYQTVYSKDRGSAAAPTAGLHFTRELLGRIEEKGASIAYLTLHVGLGTFRPVKVENIEEHYMHWEYYSVSEETANIINRVKSSKGRIIAVGTTSIRTLEALANKYGKIVAEEAWTNIFIFPGYKFKIVDALITNFHLPESTLLMLVSALGGRENIFKAYRHAIANNYRFFSFGDAMFIK